VYSTTIFPRHFHTALSKPSQQLQHCRAAGGRLHCKRTNVQTDKFKSRKITTQGIDCSM